MPAGRTLAPSASITTERVGRRNELREDVGQREKDDHGYCTDGEQGYHEPEVRDPTRDDSSSGRTVASSSGADVKGQGGQSQARLPKGIGRRRERPIPSSQWHPLARPVRELRRRSAVQQPHDALHVPAGDGSREHARSLWAPDVLRSNERQLRHRSPVVCRGLREPTPRTRKRLDERCFGAVRSGTFEISCGFGEGGRN
jgi:hypothetical protein